MEIAWACRIFLLSHNFAHWNPKNAENQKTVFQTHSFFQCWWKLLTRVLQPFWMRGAWGWLSLWLSHLPGLVVEKISTDMVAFLFSPSFPFLYSFPLEVGPLKSNERVLGMRNPSRNQYVHGGDCHRMGVERVEVSMHTWVRTSQTTICWKVIGCRPLLSAPRRLGNVLMNVVHTSDTSAPACTRLMTQRT